MSEWTVFRVTGKNLDQLAGEQFCKRSPSGQLETRLIFGTRLNFLSHFVLARSERHSREIWVPLPELF
jgi:hypothetical protein